MAITFDYNDPAEYVIEIPKADLTLIETDPTEIRQLNIDDFRTQLMGLQDNAEHQWAPTTHKHTAPHTIAGVTYAREVLVLDPYRTRFEDGLYNVNIVGGNSNFADVTIKNQVGVNTANSAGLQDPFSLQAAAFGGKVALDQNVSSSGTTFPYGTIGYPVNNATDALYIAEQRGIRTFLLMSDTTLNAGDFSDAYNFEGNHVNVSLTLGGTVNVTNCEFSNLAVQGVFSGGADPSNAIMIKKCMVGDISALENAHVCECILTGTITLTGTPTVDFCDCSDGLPGAGTPIVNIGTVPAVGFWGYIGGLKIQNLSNPAGLISVNLSTGRVILDSTITAGTILVKGVGLCENNSTASVDTDGLIGKASVVEAIEENADIARTRKHMTNRLETNPTTGVATLYDDDDATPLETSDMFEDVDGTQPYRGKGAERRNKFS